MQAVIDRNQIQDVFTSMTILRRKADAVDQEKLVNNFLDSILALRMMVNESAESLENLEQQLMNITHIDSSKLLPEDYSSLEKLVIEAQKLYSISMRFYAALRSSREEGYITNEATRYKIATEDFKETYQDIRIAFLTPPKTEAFNTTGDRLAALLK